MKTIILSTIVVFGLISLPSCQDQLDLEPISAIGENGFYNTPKEMQTAVIAIYDGWQNVALREFALTEMRSDNTETRLSEGDWAQFESFNVKPTNVAVSQYWSTNYNVIFRANKVLEKLNVVTDNSLKNLYEGEAKFSRALAYFNLVRAFGGVPIVDKVIIQSNTDYFDRDTESAVYDFIVSDLQFAINTLPTRKKITEGRATVGAAKAFLAKVYLTQGKHSLAKPLLDQVIADPDYSLQSNYNNIFYNERNSEIIFAIQYLNDNVNESQDFSHEMTASGHASGLNHITDDFASTVDPSETIRSSVLFRPNNVREVGKFIPNSANVRLAGNDWIVLRLADVLLMHAESIMAGTSSTNSLDAIGSYNAVRQRAGMPTLATDGTAVLTKEMLLNERRVELAFENHRLYDLIRFGMAESVLSAFATKHGYNFSATDLLLPIPQREIDTSAGLLKQNNGY